MPINEIQATSNITDIPIGPRGLQMRNVGDLMMFIRAMSSSGMAPDNKGDNDLLIRAHYGMSIGLDPMRAVQSIYVVRNRPCVWGAAVPGLILASGKCKRWEVTNIGQHGTDSYGVQIVTERHDIAGVNTFTFTMRDARAAGLLGKDTWKNYPSDMMRWKAIGRAAGAVYGDILYGLSIVENERDIEDAEVIPEEPQTEPIEPAPATPTPAPEPDNKQRFRAACAILGIEPSQAVADMVEYFGVASVNDVAEDQRIGYLSILESNAAALQADGAPEKDPSVIDSSELRRTADDEYEDNKGNKS